MIWGPTCYLFALAAELEGLTLVQNDQLMQRGKFGGKKANE